MTFREFANSSNETNNKPAEEQRDKPKLLDQVRITLRANHYSRKAEEAYLSWIKRFILFNNKRHPSEMGRRIYPYIIHKFKAVESTMDNIL